MLVRTLFRDLSLNLPLTYPLTICQMKLLSNHIPSNSSKTLTKEMGRMQALYSLNSQDKLQPLVCRLHTQRMETMCSIIIRRTKIKRAFLMEYLAWRTLENRCKISTRRRSASSIMRGRDLSPPRGMSILIRLQVGQLREKCNREQ